MDFSVIVCTYNRADLLRTSLSNLIAQHYPSDQYEILVIDNCSTDHTASVVKDLQKQSSILHYFVENNIGLSYARNRGLKEAKGIFVCYTDDDCEIPANWLLTARNVIDQQKVKLLGGPVFPFYQHPKPVWYKDEYALLEHGTASRKLNETEYLFGGNFFIDKGLLEAFHGFDVQLGMSGNKIGYSEETDLQIRIANKDAAIAKYYEPGLFVKHIVRPEKMTIKWILKAAVNKGKDNFKMRTKEWLHVAGKSYGLASFQIAKSFLIIAVHFFIAFLIRRKQEYPYWQNYICERTLGHFRKIGYYLQQQKEV